MPSDLVGWVMVAGKMGAPDAQGTYTAQVSDGLTLHGDQRGLAQEYDVYRKDEGTFTFSNGKFNFVILKSTAGIDFDDDPGHRHEDYNTKGGPTTVQSTWQPDSNDADDMVVDYPGVDVDIVWHHNMKCKVLTTFNVSTFVNFAQPITVQQRQSAEAKEMIEVICAPGVKQSDKIEALESAISSSWPEAVDALLTVGKVGLMEMLRAKNNNDPAGIIDDDREGFVETIKVLIACPDWPAYKEYLKTQSAEFYHPFSARVVADSGPMNVDARCAALKAFFDAGGSNYADGHSLIYYALTENSHLWKDESNGKRKMMLYLLETIPNGKQELKKVIDELEGREDDWSELVKIGKQFL